VEFIGLLIFRGSSTTASEWWCDDRILEKSTRSGRKDETNAAFAGRDANPWGHRLLGTAEE